MPTSTAAAGGKKKSSSRATSKPKPKSAKSSFAGYTKTARKDAKGRVVYKNGKGEDRVRCKAASGANAGKLTWRKASTVKQTKHKGGTYGDYARENMTDEQNEASKFMYNLKDKEPAKNAFDISFSPARVLVTNDETLNAIIDNEMIKFKQAVSQDDRSRAKRSLNGIIRSLYRDPRQAQIYNYILKWTATLAPGILEREYRNEIKELRDNVTEKLASLSKMPPAPSSRVSGETYGIDKKWHGGFRF